MMTKKTGKPTAQPKAVQQPEAKPYIVFGADEYARPRAARFLTSEIEPLQMAAAAMNARLFEVNTPELAEIMNTLPAGRLHASGDGFLPYVKGQTYSELLSATVADEWPQPASSPKAKDLPGSWDQVSPGHVVIARETFECGWWEAVVIERTGDLVKLRYRDYPKYSPIVRHRSAVALIGAAAP